MPPNSLSLRGSHLKHVLRLIALVVVALIADSCAKFPSNGASQYTQIRVTVTMAGPVSVNYLYYVALYGTTVSNPDLSPSGVGPIPTLTTGSANGWLTGSATQFVQMTPGTGRPFAIYNVGTPADPGIDNTLTRYTDDTLTPDSQGNYPSTWSFTIYTTDLADASIAQTLKSLVFQVVAMNKPAITTSSGRILDALGQLTNFTKTAIRLDYSNTVSNSSLGSIEPTNDCVGGYDPALDITDFNVQVIVP